MTVRTIVPEGWQRWSDELGYAPATEAGGFVFMSGCTGTRLDDTIASNPEQQIRDAFDNLACVLAAAGVGFDDVVDMTTYHVEMSKHIEAFTQIKGEYFGVCRPAWTAIGVPELYGPGTIVEIKVVALRKEPKQEA